MPSPPIPLLTPHLAQAIYERTMARLERRFVPYRELDRPRCAFCPLSDYKWAVFFDLRRHRAVCARCALDLARFSVRTEATA